MASLRAGERRLASGAIAGRIATRSQTPISGATVMIVGDSPEHLDIAAVTNATGEYGFTDLTPGEYEIQANANDRLQVQRVGVRAGEVARLDFTVEG